MIPTDLLALLSLLALLLVFILVCLWLARANVRALEVLMRPPPSHRLNARQFATLEITKAALRSYGLTALKPEHIEQAKQAAALIVEDAP